jgi:hypothetical protein
VLTSSSDRFVRLALLLSISVVATTQLPALATNRGQLLPAVVLLLAAGVTLGGRRTARAASASAIVVLTPAALQIIALLRFADHPVGDVGAHTAVARAVLIAALAALLWAALWRHPTPARLRAAVLAPVAFVIVNFAAYIAGVRAPVDPNATYGEASMLGALHIAFGRSAMPLTPGLNGGGMMAAIGFVISLLLIPKYQRRGRLLLASAAGISIATILMTDSRAALVVSLTTVMLLWLLPRFARRGLAVAALLLPVMPMIVIWAVNRVEPILSNFTRTPGDTSTPGRMEIWAAVIDKLMHPGLGAGLFEQLFGYGFYGQVVSGVSYEYGYLFYGPSASYRSAHSLVLQTLLNQGIVGLGVLIAVTWFVLRSAIDRSQADPSSSGLAIAGGFICILLLGATEAVADPATPYALAAFVVLCCASVRTIPVSTALATEDAGSPDIGTYQGRRGALS